MKNYPTETVFVFGSNLAGRHGKGAALTAKNKYGAVYGVGEGRTGNSYALPTKDANLQTLPLTEIKKHVENFLRYAGENPLVTFHLTPVGTGLAGYSKKTIVKLFKESSYPIPTNVVLTSSWFD